MISKAKDIKKIGHFQIRFTTSFDNARSNNLSLKLLITDDLRKFIKDNVVINSEELSSYNNGELIKDFKRYKVRSFWFSCLSRQRELIFSKELIDSGSVVFEFAGKDYVEEAINNIKENFNLLVKNVIKYKDIDVTITYN